MSVFCQSQVSDEVRFPEFEEVVTRFFNTYAFDDMLKESELEFHKKKRGWYVSLINDDRLLEVNKSILFWDGDWDIYLQLEFQRLKIKNTNELKLDYYLSYHDYNAYDYKVSPYYGYRGWDADVIRDYANVSDLSSSGLYALGRAYSSYASNLLNDNSGLSSNENRFFQPEGLNSLTLEQLEIYRKYRHKAIEIFDKIAVEDPSFVTKVDKIRIKAANEYLTSFLDLRIYQNEQEAQKELKPNLYPDLYIFDAKNHLTSCPKNSILFTYGDNDTYPLLYVQSQLGFRTDVLVVNTSLLFTSAYVNSLRQPILEAASLPLSFSAESLKDDNLEIIAIEKTASESIKLTDAIAHVKEKNHEKTEQGMTLPFITSDKLTFSADNKTLNFEISEAYIYRDQLLVLDVLASNNWKRPICFTYTTALKSIFSWKENLVLLGIVYQLDTTLGTKGKEDFGSINTDVMYQNLMENFDYDFLKINDDEKNIQYLFYRHYFHKLAAAFIDEGKTDQAEVVLDSGLEKFPNELYKFSFLDMELIEDYYILGAFEKGNRMIKQLVKNNVNNDFDALTYSKEKREALLGQLIFFTEKYDQKAMNKELKSISDIHFER